MVALAPFRTVRDALTGVLGRRFPVTVVGHLPTDRAGRYGRKLASHLGRKATAEWDDVAGRGTITFAPGERVVLTATPDALLTTLTCPSARVDELKDVIERHLLRFGAKEGLTMTWQDGR